MHLCMRVCICVCVCVFVTRKLKEKGGWNGDSAVQLFLSHWCLGLLQVRKLANTPVTETEG